MGNQFPPNGWLRQTPAATNSGCKPTFKEILRGAEAAPADTELDGGKWQDKYSSFQSQIATHNMFICIQWEEKTEMLNMFLAHCEDQQANEACQG